MNKGAVLASYYRALFAKKWSKERVEKHRQKRIEIIRSYARKHSPYYRSREGFPLTCKKEMMEFFSTFNTLGISREQALNAGRKGEDLGAVTVGLSSGTSGEQGVFLASAEERERWCGQALAKLLPRSLFSKQSVGLFLRANSSLYESVRSKRVSFYFFDLQRPFLELYEELLQKKPTVLVAPPSVLRLLAEKGCYRPEKIISCAEQLDPLDQKIIEEGFGLALFQIYQCTEGFLGYSCPFGSIHINEDLVYIEKEWIDEKRGSFIPIVTDLYRKTQPIIRYRLDDVLIERKTACPCGSSHLALSAIEGRWDDLLYVHKEKGEGLIPIFPDYLRRIILLVSPNTTSYELIQIQPDTIHLFITPPSNEIKKALEDYIALQGGKVPHIEFLASLPKREMHNKLRRIKRSFHVETNTLL